MSNVQTALQQLQAFFDQKIREHGASAKGVDWRDETSQHWRFAQLMTVVRDRTQAFTVLDYGCGYGALVDFLEAQGYHYTYIGYDMTPAVIDQARQTYAAHAHCTFTTDENALPSVDYVLGSGLFNMKFDTPEPEWEAHMFATIQRMWGLSQKGLAFNTLTSYSDAAYMRADLYYPDPKHLFDYCKRNLSRNVALLHDYDLYDCTFIVRPTAQ